VGRVLARRAEASRPAYASGAPRGVAKNTRPDGDGVWLLIVNEKIRNNVARPRVDGVKGNGIHMARRDDLIKAEALELWKQTHDEPPPEVSGGELLEIICRDLVVRAYDRVQSPFLRPTMILRPEEWPEAGRAVALSPEPSR